MQTYDCHACYVRGNEVDELTKNFKEAYGLLLVRNNVLAERIAKLEKDIPWFFDRIAELEQENIEFIDVNIYEHSVAEKSQATIKRVTTTCTTQAHEFHERSYPYSSLGIWVRVEDIMQALGEAK